MVISALLLLVAVIGFVGVQKTGNYENNYGYMMIWGGIGFIISLLVKLVLVLL